MRILYAYILPHIDITNDSRIDQDPNLKTLTRRIEWQLKQRGFCIVFEDEVERCWPSEKIKPTERLNQIEAFAEFRGWKASVFNNEIGGMRIILEDQ